MLSAFIRWSVRKLDGPLALITLLVRLIFKLPPNKWPHPQSSISDMSWKMALTVPFHKLIFETKNDPNCAIFQLSQKMTSHPIVLHTPTLKYSYYGLLSLKPYFILKIAGSVPKVVNICETLAPHSIKDLFYQVNFSFERPTSLLRPISYNLQRFAARQAYQLGEAITRASIC